MARPPYRRPGSLGSGRMNVSPNRTLVHFGSPEGTSYDSIEDETTDVVEDDWSDIEFIQRLR